MINFILIIMKVYCPSHKRPDSKLFEMTHGLNIILQFEEDVESYSKWRGRHNIIYIPELKGLLDARNWILENNDDWVLMLDDDLSGFTYNSEFIKWEEYLKIAKNILSMMDKSKVGIAGLRYRGDYVTGGHYSIVKQFEIFQAIFLNCKLLNSAGYRYEGYPYDGFNGQRAYCEDQDILYYCYENNIQMAKINSLFFDITDQPSVCWGDDKEIWLLLGQFWLLDRYKDNKVLADNAFRNIQNSLERCKDKFGEDLHSKIMEKISYGVLNKDEGETEMKKFFIGAIFFGLLMGVSGCSQDSGQKDESIPLEYQGEFFRTSQSSYGYSKIIIGKNDITLGKEQYPARTELGSDGSIALMYGAGFRSYFGTFEDKNTLCAPGPNPNIDVIYERQTE